MKIRKAIKTADKVGHVYVRRKSWPEEWVMSVVFTLYDVTIEDHSHKRVADDGDIIDYRTVMLTVSDLLATDWETTNEASWP